MKKLFAFVLLVCMIMMLGACGLQEADSQPGGTDGFSGPVNVMVLNGAWIVMM